MNRLESTIKQPLFSGFVAGVAVFSQTFDLPTSVITGLAIPALVHVGSIGEKQKQQLSSATNDEQSRESIEESSPLVTITTMNQPESSLPIVSTSTSITTTVSNTSATITETQENPQPQKSLSLLPQTTKQNECQCSSQLVSVSRKTKFLTPSEFWGGPALVVGVYQPGTPNECYNLALNADSETSYVQSQLDSNYRPDFTGDIMQIPLSTLGEGKYARIVFEGVCPVATAMGAKPCNADYGFNRIDAHHLAYRLNALISKNGAYVFFRHCAESATNNGVEDQDARKKFIEIFENEGFKLMQAFHPPLLLTHPHPGKDLPDACPEHSSKWEPKNGSLIFYKLDL